MNRVDAKRMMEATCTTIWMTILAENEIEESNVIRALHTTNNTDEMLELSKTLEEIRKAQKEIIKEMANTKARIAQNWCNTAFLSPFADYLEIEEEEEPE